MRMHLPSPAAAALLAAAPADAATRNFTITGFDRIRVDGPFQVKLTTSVAPLPGRRGSQAALDALSIDGRRAGPWSIRPSASGWSGYAGQAERAGRDRGRHA